MSLTEFDEIFRKYYPRLICYTKKFVKREEDAFNIVQDIFVAVYEKKIFSEKEEILKSYLFTAARHHCLNFLKHLKVVHKYENNIQSELSIIELRFFSSGEKSLIEKETINDLHEAINSLTDIHKEVIILSRFEGLKNKEISERLQIPLRTVETRLFRALSQLKELLVRNHHFIFHVFSFIKRIKRLSF